MKKRLFIFLLLLFVIPISKAYAMDVIYETHVQDYGWLPEVSNGELGGTTGKSKRMEALKIWLDNKEYEGDIVYQAHVQDYGWLSEVVNGELGGTTGKSKRVEAVKIHLSGELAEHYDVYYRAHVQDYGWLSWVKNGELGGTTGQSKRVEAFEIKLVDKEEVNASISYTIHNADGWQEYSNSGEVSGVTGASKRVDQLKIKLENESSKTGGINYSVYTPSGWQDAKNSDEVAGDETSIEAIKVNLTGELANIFNVCYRAHVSNIGWMDYTCNGEPAGTVGYFNKIEAVEVALDRKDNPHITTGSNHYMESNNRVLYSSHVANIGWMDYVSDGELSGTTGRSLAMESFKIKLDTKLSGDVRYNVYVDRRGWGTAVTNDAVAGTTGLSRRMEAISIKLTGEISNYYDIYYRTHVSDIGWLSWAKNGEKSGCIDSSAKIESIEIKLVKKELEFNEDISKPYVTGKWVDNKFYDYFGRMATGFKLIDGVKCFFNTEGKLYGKDVKKVIDVSSWQDDIDWDTIKRDDDVDAAILRVGYGSSYGEDCGLDSRFARNIAAVQRLGIPYEIYIYGYAENETAVNREANFVADTLEAYNVPKNVRVWYDAEITWFGRSVYEAIVPAFFRKLSERGYTNYGLYSGVRQLDTTNGNLNSADLRNYKIWVAQYYKDLQYTGDYVGWQYSSSEHINGINGSVDVSMFK